MHAIDQTLQDVFGLERFRPGQREIIEKLIEGSPALAVFPTGGGKSLCYQLTALHLDGLTVVVSPLLALMKDQIDFLVGRGIAAARLDSTLEPEEVRSVYDALRASRLKLLYVAPERFANEGFRQMLERQRLSLFVVDEAHCISEWGHNFRPDYLRLARLSQQLGVRRVLALTATATPEVGRDICSAFDIVEDAYVNTGFYRANLTLRVSDCSSLDRQAVLEEHLKSRPRGATIVYVTLRSTAEAVAERLVEIGFPALCYHAGLDRDARQSIQDRFMASPDAIVVATIAFGMGIDKSDIRYVYHFNLPKGLESYSQEIGRAGRDGEPSTCELLANADDVIVLENFVFGDTPQETAVRSLVNELLDHSGELELANQRLADRHDIRSLVVSTLITYLELEGLLVSTGARCTTYRFQPRRSSQEILARFDPERAAFLARVFQAAKKGRTWLTIDVPATATALSETRERITKALNFLGDRGDLELKPSGFVQGYRLTGPPEDREALHQKMQLLFRERERRDVERVHQVVRLAQSSSCLTRELLSHFGEDLGRDCGHCSPCLGDPRIELSRSGEPLSLEEIDLAAVEALRSQHPESLAEPRQLARFLCGLTSPRLAKSKLTRHELFGRFERVPFSQVLELARESLGDRDPGEES